MCLLTDGVYSTLKPNTVQIIVREVMIAHHYYSHEEDKKTMAVPYFMSHIVDMYNKYIMHTCVRAHRTLFIY